MRGLLIALAWIASLAAGPAALAHGGSFRGGNGGGAGDPPPGPADDVSTLDGWESWWANNRAVLFRRTARPRAPAVATTPGGAAPDPEAAPPDPAEAEAERIAVVRGELVPVFILALDDPSIEVRSAAVIALGKTGDAAGLGPLQRKARTDAEREIRDAALLALGILGSPDAIPFLGDVLDDENATSHRRAFAALALGLVGGHESAVRLVAFMTTPTGQRHRGDAQLHAACFTAMGIAGDDAVLPALWLAGADASYDERVRASAWLAIGRRGDRTSLAALVRALETPQESVAVRRAAALALRSIARPGDASAVEALTATMRTSTDPLTRRFAAMTLAGIGGARAQSELRTAFAKADDAGRAFLAITLAVAQDREAVPLLRKALLAGGSESFRGGAATALGLLRATDCRDVLEAQVAARGAVWPQGYAAVALGMAGCAESAPVLAAELARTRDPRLRVNLAVGLALLHDPSTPAWFVDTLRDPKESIYLRGAAAMSLGLLRFDESMPVLADVACRSAENEMLRAYAVAALGMLADASSPPRLSLLSAGADYTLQNDALDEVLGIY